jgi:hypothetical protein
MMTNSELCIPAAALPSTGNTPAQGETVTVPNVKGTVTRVEGGNIYMRPTEANGQPLDAQPDKDPEKEPTAEDLLSRAAEVDGEE